MKILVIGGGGREHAISWKLAQSKSVEEVFVAPGNAGTTLESKIKNIELSNNQDIINFIKNNQIDFSVVGPEQPLADGLVDELLAENLAVIGPRKNSAMLETSKIFAKEMLNKAGIKSATYKVFNDADLAKNYVNERGAPIVIKADGLAAGKGVVVAGSIAQAHGAIDNIMIKRAFGSAGEKIIVEDCLIGREASFIVLTDGKNIAPLTSAQDHKRLLDGDNGPNTGGMGVIVPSPLINKAMQDKVIKTVIKPIIDLLNKEMPYSPAYVGFLYAGLMIDEQGNINVLEFNCRLGDPETQPLLYGQDTDLAEIFQQTVTGDLSEDAFTRTNNNLSSVGVVLASGGYPLSVQKNEEIFGLEEVGKIENVKVFHAGTKIENGKVLVNGGRVLCVTAKGEDLRKARKSVYLAVSKIKFAGMQYRTDI